MGILDKNFIYTPSANTDITETLRKHGANIRQHSYDELARLRKLRRQLDAHARFKDGFAYIPEHLFEEMLADADGCGND